jgi:hypothetical protein
VSAASDSMILNLVTKGEDAFNSIKDKIFEVDNTFRIADVKAVLYANDKFYVMAN